jgi:hypothetical protein
MAVQGWQSGTPDYAEPSPYQAPSGVLAKPPEKLDPYQIQYGRLSPTEWQQIPNQVSEYSHYWDPASLQPEKFAENTKEETKCNDLFWTILFILNLIATIVLMAIALAGSTKSSSSLSEKSSSGNVGNAIGIGFGFAVVISGLHFCYCTFAPNFYIKFSLLIGLVLSIVIGVLLAVNGLPGFIAFPSVVFLLVGVTYCVGCSVLPLSAAVLETTCHILLKHPTVFLLIGLNSLLQIGFAVFYIAAFYAISEEGMSPFMFIYFFFSYFWVTFTIEYVVYMTVSGVFSTWYFLNETEYYPESPVAGSFGRACTTSFGSAALAAFLMAVVSTLETIVQSTDPSSGQMTITHCLIRCCALCCLLIVKCFIQLVTRYALIYCAAFGVPFVEGCRRYLELMCTRYAELLFGNILINCALTMNWIVFVVFTIFATFGVSHIALDWSSGSVAIACVTAALCSFALFAVLSEPLVTGSDTLIVCYLEAPDRLASSAKDLAERLNMEYAERLGEVITLRHQRTSQR